MHATAFHCFLYVCRPIVCISSYFPVHLCVLLSAYAIVTCCCSWNKKMKRENNKVIERPTEWEKERERSKNLVVCDVLPKGSHVDCINGNRHQKLFNNTEWSVWQTHDALRTTIIIDVSTYTQGEKGGAEMHTNTHILHCAHRSGGRRAAESD